MPSLRRKAIFWATIALVVNVAFIVWLLSVPSKASCDGLVGIDFDNCLISHSGRGMTIAMIVFAWLFVDGGLAILFYTSWSRPRIPPFPWFRTRRWRRE
jgi:NhaP-type Na+/H+ and K+/H+ antiporter